MIIEGLCTTLNQDGSVNIAPMGPVVDPELSRFLFRPFQSSRTFENLSRERCGVFHVVDDVLLIAQAALGEVSERPDMFPAKQIPGHVLASACRWYEFTVTEINASQPRSEITTQLAYTGVLRHSFGFNRAKHAVLEATILCTRLHLLSAAEIDQQWPLFTSAVNKTGGPQELAAFEYVERYLQQARNRTVDSDQENRSSKV